MSNRGQSLQRRRGVGVPVTGATLCARQIMPSKPLNPGKPAFYLDHSTLCDAFRADKLRDGTDPCYRPLVSWIERVANEANLCLSETHLLELSRWNEPQAALRMAHWYESMPVVWTKWPWVLLREEHDYWLKVALGLAPGDPPQPFVGSFPAAMRAPTVDFAAACLTQSKSGVLVPALIQSMRHAHVSRLVERKKAAIVDEAATIRKHRPALTLGREQAIRQELRQNALEAKQRLLKEPNAGRFDVPLDEDVAEAYLHLWDANPAALPATRVLGRLHVGFVDAALRRQGPSQNEERAALGTFDDTSHAMAGAYCTVFTCDGRVAETLGDLRRQLGVSPQLSVAEYGGDVERFVADLVSYWP